MQFRLYTVLMASLPMSAQDFYSREREAALGAGLAKEVQQRTGPIDNAVIRDYVERTGSRLAAQLPGTGFPYLFSVISGDVGGRTHEPLSLPGGYIFVPGTLILTCQTEAEFAGMLAHAMAHTAERHGTRQAARAIQGNLTSLPLIFMGGWMGGQEGLIPLAVLDIHRRFETEADALAVRAMADAGYDPEALVSYIRRVQPGDGETSKMSALPPRDSRITAMENTIRELPSKTYVATDEFPRIQEELRRLLPSPVRRVPTLYRPNERPQNQ